jgi:hypothetical protein
MVMEFQIKTRHYSDNDGIPDNIEAQVTNFSTHLLT